MTLPEILALGDKLAAEATARPYKLRPSTAQFAGQPTRFDLADSKGDRLEGSRFGLSEADAAYIVHAANHYPTLAARVRELEKKNAELQQPLSRTGRRGHGFICTCDECM